MQLSAALLIVLLGSASGFSTRTHDVHQLSVEEEHPIKQVITQLVSLKDETITQVQTEKVDHATAVSECEHNLANHKKTMADQHAEKEKQHELMEKNQAEMDRAELKLDDLKVEMDKLDAFKASLEESNKKDSALNANDMAEVKETLEALATVKQQLIEVQKSGKDKAVNTGFLQRAGEHTSISNAMERLELTGSFTADQINEIRSFLNGPHDDHVDAVKTHMQGVIDLIDQLHNDFEDQKAALNEAKVNIDNQHKNGQESFDRQKKANDDSKELNEGDHANALSNNNEAQIAKGDAEKKFKEAEDDHETESKECNEAQNEFEGLMKNRDEELVAIDKAVEILGEVSGVRTDVTYEAKSKEGLAPAEFLQLRASSKPNKDKKLKEAKSASEEVLKMIASHNSHVVGADLERLRMAISAHEDGPFGPVINMIQKMIAHVQKEQIAENERRAWCKLEQDKTQTTIDEKNDKIEGLDAKLLALSSTRTQLEEDIKDLVAAVARNQKELSKETAEREERRLDNKKTLHDIKLATDALNQAIAVLKGVYTKDDTETAEGMPKKTGSNVIGFIEDTVLANQVQFRTDVEKADKTDQDHMDELKQRITIENAEKEQERKLKETKLRQTVDKHTVKTKNMEETKLEHHNFNIYKDELVKACGEPEAAETKYQERVQSRNSELASLKQAECIFQNAYDEQKEVTEICPLDKFTVSPAPMGEK